MKGSRLVVVGVVVLVAASIAAYEVYQASRIKWGGFDYASASRTFHCRVRDGLELTATVKEVFLPEGQILTLVEEVNDTLSTPLTVNATSMVNPAYGPCQQGFATGVVVYSGNLTNKELCTTRSTPAPLLLYNPSLIYACPAVFSWQYSFRPQSALATVQGTLGGYHMKNQIRLVEETSIVAGYWVGGQFQKFPVGQYTVVAFDAWGDRAVGHFQVVA